MFLMAYVGLGSNASLSSQDERPPVPAQLSASRIVAEMQLHDRMRRQTVVRYEATRHYSVEYHGFFHTLKAAMEVHLSYDARTGKSFRILAESGSGFLLEEVLKRAVESEQEASQDLRGTELSTRNYTFELLGRGSVNGRPAYILRVHPLYRGKYLYEGKILVDAADFAVARIEAEPAKSPSFWITRTQIFEEYAPIDGLWLPQLNRSKTKVRFGGTALLTIDYGTYTIVPRDPQAPASK